MNRGTTHVSAGAPGATSAGLRTATFAQASEGVLELGLGGRTPYAHNGWVAVTGAPAELAGTLALISEAGFESLSDQVLVLISAPGGFTGALDSVSGAESLPGGRSGSVQVEVDRVALFIEDGG
jgi:hypothetical protein